MSCGEVVPARWVGGWAADLARCRQPPRLRTSSHLRTRRGARIRAAPLATIGRSSSPQTPGAFVGDLVRFADLPPRAESDRRVVLGSHPWLAVLLAPQQARSPEVCRQADDI